MGPDPVPLSTMMLQCELTNLGVKHMDIRLGRCCPALLPHTSAERSSICCFHYAI
jgi:hypothetical protein